MRLGLCLMLSALALALTGCQSEAKPPEAAAPAAPAITLNTTEPAAVKPEAEPILADDTLRPLDPVEEAPAAGGASGLTKDFLMHQKFVLVQVNEADYSPDNPDLPAPTLEFGDDFQVSGRICNTYRGQGELQDDVLSVRAVASTRMLCPNTNLGQLETSFFKMLENGATLSMDGDRLSLKQGGSSLVFKAQTGS